MDFGDSEQEGEFRRDLRAWLSERMPIADPPHADADRLAYLSDWHGQLYDGGWAAVSFAPEWGGRGLPNVFEAIVLDELARAGAPAGWRFGYVAKIIERYGTDEQKRSILPATLRGDQRWCQGFSEPDAGSDLAGLRTVATPVGDTYVVNGQKVWTSEAHWADWCLLLARTDATVSKHAGLSSFVVRTDAPGLTVRPFRQITGSLDFAELFFDDVVIPADQMVGNPGDGWAIAMSTVAAERGPADVGFIADLQRIVGRLESAVRTGEVALDDDAQLALARVAIAVHVLRVHVLRSLSRRDAGLATDADASVDKLLMTTVEQDLGHVVLDVLGARSLLGTDGRSESVVDALAAHALRDYLWSRAASIYGGTEQIQKTIVATRLLRLPRSS